MEGGKRLSGRVAVSGAKNSALKVLAASLLAPGAHRFHRIPRILDVETMVMVLEELGARVEWGEPLVVDTAGVSRIEAPYELVQRMRASILVLGPLLARFGRARVAMPGGCNLGPRRLDLHFKGLAALGAEVRVARGYIEARAVRLRGAHIVLDYPSVGATENLLMASVLAEGETVIENAAREPEVVDLASYLARMGARVEGAGTGFIRVEGVERLLPGEHAVIPDRIEAGTYALAAAATGGEVLLDRCVPGHLGIFLAKLEESGAEVEVLPGGVRVRGPDRPLPTDIATLPYPGFPTDLMPPFVAYLARARGMSIVTENVFENRFAFVEELARMGASVRTEGHHALVTGVEVLTGAPVRAPDIRAGAALVVAALAAEGETLISGMEHVDRGYEDLEAKLEGLGAVVRREEVSG